MKSGTTVESVDTSKLKNFNIPIANEKEQQEIVRILDALLEKEQQAKDLAEAQLAQIDTLKKSILARAFRGELDTSRQSDRSAMEELKAYFEGEGES